MKKLILTSPAYVGEILVLYGTAQELLVLDFSGAELNFGQIAFFLKNTPPVYEEGCIRAKNLTVQDLSLVVSFEEFWNKYDKKINKDRCIRLWAKLSKADQIKSVYKMNAYLRHLNSNAWKTQADPETYLRNKYWNNEWR